MFFFLCGVSHYDERKRLCFHLHELKLLLVLAFFQIKLCTHNNQEIGQTAT